MSKHIVVVLGGETPEREISLRSGEACARALKEAGYRVSTVDPSGDPAVWIHQILDLEPHAIFNALHGPFGEGGQIQGLFEAMQIPYTHSGVRASAIAMDKLLSKSLFAKSGLTVAEDKEVTLSQIRSSDPLPRPYVLKPVEEGSSIGVIILEPNIIPDLSPLQGYKRLMAERFIPGRELTVCCFSGEAKVVTELAPSQKFYDFKAKYTDGVTHHTIPADLPSDIYKKCLRDTETAYKALGCLGLARADFRYNPNAPKGQQLVILEINTQPGMTELSLAPEQAAFLGQSFIELVTTIVEDASCNR